MTIQEAHKNLTKELKGLYDEREAANISHWVMEHLTGLNKLDRIVYKDRLLEQSQVVQLQNYTASLLTHQPVQYVLHEAWFAGMALYVDEHVLIPRPETEELVEWIVLSTKDEVPGTKRELNIIDIGTGSGCIPLALKKYIPQAHIHAIDISEGALSVAARNASVQLLDVDFHQLDILAENNWNTLGHFDIIVSNPPYIKESEASVMHNNVLQHEPHVALFVPDNDPLLFYRKIAEFGKIHLKPGGYLFFEINEAHGKETAGMLIENGYTQVEIKIDLQGKERMIRAIGPSY
ncbi:MAG: peptide chain release factor N(5)-glutamine methyltransferase [Filimonas sp.]|nr:peptide chain release factor N(5)-glutamine methyltransferase [Filimonas sp.]